MTRWCSYRPTSSATLVYCKHSSRAPLSPALTGRALNQIVEITHADAQLTRPALGLIQIKAEQSSAAIRYVYRFRNLERAGVSRSDAMKMIGHKTERIYRRYAIADERSIKEAATKLDQFYALDQRPTEILK